MYLSPPLYAQLSTACEHPVLQSRTHLSLPQFDSVSSLYDSGVLVVEATQPLVKDL